jgi:hypothetical protein
VLLNKYFSLTIFNLKSHLNFLNKVFVFRHSFGTIQWYRYYCFIGHVFYCSSKNPLYFYFIQEFYMNNAFRLLNSYLNKICLNYRYNGSLNFHRNNKQYLLINLQINMNCSYASIRFNSKLYIYLLISKSLWTLNWFLISVPKV